MGTLEMWASSLTEGMMYSVVPNGADASKQVAGQVVGEQPFGKGPELSGPGRVLVIANDQAVQSVLATLTTVEGCEAMASAHGPEAYQAIRAWQPRVILVDLDDVVEDTVEIVSTYREFADANIPIIVISASPLGDEWLADMAVAAALPKPFAATQFLELLRQFAHCSS